MKTEKEKKKRAAVAMRRREQESTSSFKTTSRASSASFVSFDMADRYVACEYEEIPSWRWLSPSFRWISRSFQRSTAATPPRSSSAANPEKIKKGGSRNLLSFLWRRTVKQKSDVQPRLTESEERSEKESRLTESEGGYSADAEEEQSDMDDLVFADDIAIAGRFHIEELLSASAELLGRGSLGTTYKSVLQKGDAVAVKRLRNHPLPVGKFNRRMRRIIGVRHSHVLSPMAYYYLHKDEGVILYDFMPLGSIHSVLHGRSPREWEVRLTWIRQVAQGLSYVHSYSEMAHGCLKSSNILLNHDGEACIADLGLFMLVDLDINICRCYAPLHELRNYTQATDVYAFGVLIFELVLMKPPWTINDDGSRQVVEFVEEVKSANGDVEKLLESSDLSSSELVEMANMLALGLECVREEPPSRPSMKEVEQQIETMTLKRSNPAVNEHGLVVATLNDATEGADDQAPITSSLPETIATELDQEERTMHKDTDLPRQDANLSAPENGINKETVISNISDASTEAKDEPSQTIIVKENTLTTSSRTNSQDSVEVLDEGTIGIREHVSTDEIFSVYEDGIKKGPIISSLKDASTGIDGNKSAAEIMDHVSEYQYQKQVLPNEGTAGSQEIFDIGIPLNYFSVGRMDRHQFLVVKGLIASLRVSVKSGDRFDEIMECVKEYTTELVALRTPLEEWNSLAQYVLHAVKETDDLKAESERRSMGSITKRVATLQVKVEETSHLIEHEESNLDSSRQRLAQAEQHQIHVRQKIEDLKKQIEDLQGKAKSGDVALISINEEVKLVETRLAENKLRLEAQKKEISIAAEELELAGAAEKGNEEAMSALIKSALQKLSSFS